MARERSWCAFAYMQSLSLLWPGELGHQGHLLFPWMFYSLRTLARLLTDACDLASGDALAVLQALKIVLQTFDPRTTNSGSLFAVD